MNIKQIIPADGWWAVVRRNGDKSPYIYRVACWALTECSDGQCVTAMVKHDSEKIWPMCAIHPHWEYFYGRTYKEVYEKVTGCAPGGRRVEKIFTTSFSDESN